MLSAPRAEPASIRDSTIGSVPVTTWTPDHPRGPVVVVVHGLAGSRQVMQPYALALARTGFTTLTLHLPGHGANPRPLRWADLREGPAESLERALDAVVGQARRLGDGRVALVGHSIGANAVGGGIHGRPAGHDVGYGVGRRLRGAFPPRGTSGDLP